MRGKVLCGLFLVVGCWLLVVAGEELRAVGADLHAGEVAPAMVLPMARGEKCMSRMVLS